MKLYLEGVWKVQKMSEMQFLVHIQESINEITSSKTGHQLSSDTISVIIYNFNILSKKGAEEIQMLKAKQNLPGK